MPSNANRSAPVGWPPRRPAILQGEELVHPLARDFPSCAPPDPGRSSCPLELSTRGRTAFACRASQMPATLSAVTPRQTHAQRASDQRHIRHLNTSVLHAGQCPHRRRGKPRRGQATCLRLARTVSMNTPSVPPAAKSAPLRGVSSPSTAFVISAAGILGDRGDERRDAVGVRLVARRAWPTNASPPTTTATTPTDAKTKTAVPSRDTTRRDRRVRLCQSRAAPRR